MLMDGDHLKVFVVPTKQQLNIRNHMCRCRRITLHVENDSNSHESAYEDCSGESEDEIMQYEDSVSQPNAIDNATLQEQLYSSSLL